MGSLIKRNSMFDFDKIWSSTLERDFFNKPLFSLAEERLEANTASLSASKVVAVDGGSEISVIAPGLQKEDFTINVADNVLTVSYDVSAERANFLTESRFDRSWTLKSGTDVSGIKATYESGILKVFVPSPAQRERTKTVIKVE